jgi:hypothetical protein
LIPCFKVFSGGETNQYRLWRSVHQNLQEPKIDGYVFWDQNMRIVFDIYSPISLTGVDKIKDLSIICIYIIFLMFDIHRANKRWLKVEVIHATNDMTEV